MTEERVQTEPEEQTAPPKVKVFKKSPIHWFHGGRIAATAGLTDS
jgi:hypothetical protein